MKETDNVKMPFTKVNAGENHKGRKKEYQITRYCM